MAEAAAASGNLAFFSALKDEELHAKLKFKDEDERTLLHTAAAAGVSHSVCMR